MAGAVVQIKALDAAASSATIATGTLDSNVTAGNFLYIVTNSDAADTVAISQNSGTATLGSVTELGSVAEAGVLDELTHFSVPITGSGTLDVLATFGGAQTNRCIVAIEVSGVTGVDVHDTNTDTGTNPTEDLTATVSQQPAFGIAVACFYQGGTPTVGSGWSTGATFWGVVRNGFYQTRQISAAGAITANFGNTGLDRNCSSLIVFSEPQPPPRELRAMLWGGRRVA